MRWFSVVLVLLGSVAVAGPVRAEDPPRCRGLAATIVGTPRADRIVGTPGRDVVVARAGNDVVRALAGDDVVCGGAGHDRIAGGAGADRLFGGADGFEGLVSPGGAEYELMIGDVVGGGPGDDLISLGFDRRHNDGSSLERDRLTYKHADGPVTVLLARRYGLGTATGEGHDRIVGHRFLKVIGSAYDDHVTGSAYGDEIAGRQGDDVVLAGGGRDLVFDGLTPDDEGRVTGDRDLLVGGRGDDQLASWSGEDRLVGGADDDDLSLFGAPQGVATVDGGPGDDFLDVEPIRPGYCPVAFGGPGADRLQVYPAREARHRRIDVDLAAGRLGVHEPGGACGRVSGVAWISIWPTSGGSDGPRWHVRGTDADERVDLHEAGTLVASMGGGDDLLLGSVRRDRLAGGPGDDRIYGDAGRDRADGGPGSDVCRAVERRRGCEAP